VKIPIFCAIFTKIFLAAVNNVNVLESSCEVPDILRNIYQIKFPEQIFIKFSENEILLKSSQGSSLDVVLWIPP
jgi:hypothetical protein